MIDTGLKDKRRHVTRGARWGRIVNVSTDGASGFVSEVSYGANKHALESYSRAAAGELVAICYPPGVPCPFKP